MLRFSESADIDRSQPVRFSFDGRKCVGYRGDTLASALIGCGIVQTGFAPLSHRPRGITGAGAFDDTSAVRLTEGARIVSPASVTLTEGLEARSVNGGARNSLLMRRLLGSSQHTEHERPTGDIETARRLIGNDSFDAADAVTEKIRLHTDVLIIGAGPAGSALALQASAAGLRTLVCDRNDVPDVRAFASDAAVHAERARALREAFAQAVSEGQITFLPRTHVFARAQSGAFAALTLQQGTDTCISFIHTRLAVEAVGLRETMLPFAGNDLPAVMTSSAVKIYAQRYGVSPGNAVLAVGNNDTIYETAFLLHRCGVSVKGIVDSRRNPGTLMQAALGRGLDVYQSSIVRAVEGYDRPVAAELVPADAAPDERRRQRRIIYCDALAVSGGMVKPYTGLSGDNLWQVGAVDGAGPDLSSVLSNVNRLTLRLADFFGIKAPEPLPDFADDDSDPVRHQNPEESKRELERGEQVYLSPSAEITALIPLDKVLSGNLPAVQEAESFLLNADMLGLQVDRTAFYAALRQPAEQLLKAAEAIGIGMKRLSPLYRVYLDLKAHIVQSGAFPRPACFRHETVGKRGDPLLSDVRAEYEAIMNGAAVIDRSADGLIRVVGPDAPALLTAFARSRPCRIGSIERLRPSDSGGVLLGDVLCAAIADDDFVLLPSCGDTSALTARLEYLRVHESLNAVAVRDRREAEARIVLAGPGALGVCATLLPDVQSSVCPLDFAGLRADAVFDNRRQEIELCVPAAHAEALFLAAVRAGALPTGEYARDIARIERGLPGMNELKRRPQAEATGGASVIGVRTEKKQVMRDAPDYLIAGAHRAYVTSWCYGPGSERSIGLAVTDCPEAFLGQEQVTARIASSADGVGVACFIPACEVRESV